LLPAATATAAVLVAASPASGLISLTPGAAAALAPFEPGATATATGSLTATDTNTSWTLQAEDQGSGGGKLVASPSGCPGSDATLAVPLELDVTSTLSGVSSAGTISLSAANQTVASSSSTALAATVLTASYTQPIPSTELMALGCVYTITVTYTLQ
jgi:hypothetical protein